MHFAVMFCNFRSPLGSSLHFYYSPAPSSLLLQSPNAVMFLNALICVAVAIAAGVVADAAADDAVSVCVCLSMAVFVCFGCDS